MNFLKLQTHMKNSSAYIELLKTFPPRPITAEEELTETQKAIDSLLDKGELTPDERDYLHVLFSFRCIKLFIMLHKIVCSNDFSLY